MPNVPLEQRYHQYINDQVDRILDFKENYQDKHNVKLGRFPFAIAKQGARPEPPILAFQYEDGTPEQVVEDRLATRIASEAYIQESIGKGDRTQWYREIPLDTNFVGEVTDELRRQHLVRDLDQAEEVVGRVFDEFHGKDNAALAYTKDAVQNGQTLAKTSLEGIYDNLAGDMDRHYEQVARPSQQMEALIARAEQEARTLNRTLDSILELEEQGIANPLLDPTADGKASAVPAKNASYEHNLLKVLLQKKDQERARQSDAPQPRKEAGELEADV